SPISTPAMPNNASVEAPAVKYELVHKTQYAYSARVSVSHHIARLAPRTLPRQVCVRHELRVDPVPEVTSTHVDYFGNATTFFIMQSAQQGLTVLARSLV